MDLFSYLESEEYKQTENSVEGYRLEKLEVYNWGTFHKHIWTLKLDGLTSLLTGDVGSGKSTIVDALTTLLVLPRNASYNKAADASSKERTVRTYVLGHYGQGRVYEGKGKAIALRTHKDYSVLLATFKNKGLGETLTLAAFFYFRDENLAPVRVYVTSNEELSIKTHFTNFDSDVRKLKQRLKNQGHQVYDDYTSYSTYFRKKMGNLNPQAIKLFSQTISMKKVDELTTFVRESMLDQKDLKEDIDRLVEHYQDLSGAYEAIRKSKAQIEMLNPIKKSYLVYQKNKQLLDQLGQATIYFSSWFACKVLPIFENKIKEDRILLEEKNRLFNQTKEKIHTIEDLIYKLNTEINQNDGALLERLKSDIRRYEQDLMNVKNNVQRYQESSMVLGLSVPKNMKDFVENKNNIEKTKDPLDQLESNKQEERSKIHEVKSQTETQKIKVDEELQSLKQRKTNISSKQVQLRTRICEALSIDVQQLPFVGELLEVKEEQIEWEGAIERLLHAFSLSLLVPTNLYPAVSKWVESNHLNGKLVYYRVNTQTDYPKQPTIHALSIVNKLAIKENTPYHKWLYNELVKRFDYIGCESLNELYKQKKGITKQGQIKSMHRHEKDDRKHLHDRSQYLLGFDNTKKIQIYQDQSEKLKEEIMEYILLIKKIDKTIHDCQQKKQAIYLLSTYNEFEQIDQDTLSTIIRETKNKILKIENSNDKLKQLTIQLNKALEDKDKLVDQKDQYHEAYAVLKNRIDELETKYFDYESKTQQQNETVFNYLDSIQESMIEGMTLSLSNLQECQLKAVNYINKKQQDCEIRLSSNRLKIEKSLQAFKNKYVTDTREFDDTMNSIHEYMNMYEILERDDLPRFEEKFKIKLQTNLIRDISTFRVKLKNLAEEIKQKIEVINTSLHQIDYNTGTFIKIVLEDSLDIDIKNFKAEMNMITQNSIQVFDNVEIAEEKFLQIKTIIDRFKGRSEYSDIDARWTKKVTDVRNWYLFAASEVSRTSNELVEYYTDSGGKSGGQKEKLAYTILAASLAYNYGVSDDKKRESSFRFVMIDEAFLKSSSNSATYGLNLFKTLDFQLLVVTPLEKIGTIEPFISTVGHVVQNPHTHCSQLTSMSIREYQARKEGLK